MDGTLLYARTESYRRVLGAFYWGDICLVNFHLTG